jgi:hypothetical protein
MVEQYPDKLHDTDVDIEEIDDIAPAIYEDDPTPLMVKLKNKPNNLYHAIPSPIRE